MSYVVSLSFTSQVYFERTVSCEWFRLLKESLWLLNLVLKPFSVMAIDVVTCSSGCCQDYGFINDIICETFPSRGQRALFLELHVFLLSVISHSFNIFFDCLFIFIPS